MHKAKTNRAERRAAVSDSRKKARGGWEPLSRVVGVVGHPLGLTGMIAAWSNHTYAVQVFSEQPSPVGFVRPIGIGRHDKGANFPWQDLQRIKNQLYGENAVAVEVFPAESDLVDEANMRWLMVMVPGTVWKFPDLSR